MHQNINSRRFMEEVFKMKTNKNVISVLHDLVEICKDGENGYRTAAEGVENDELRDLFNLFSRQRKELISELKKHIRRLGDEPEEKGSVLGALHRGWINIKSAVTSQDEVAIISECERGEDVAIETYEKALEINLPTDIRGLVQSQHAKIKETHDRIRELEEAHES
jgi:uncharacterized protein (TIGR02284 family)